MRLHFVAQNSYFLQGCVGVHDGSVVWSRVRGRGYPARCVTSKCVRLDEFCNACHGRVETVLDCFQSRQSRTSGGKINEHFTRVSSRIEPAYLFNLRERAEFPRFREKIRVPFDYLPWRVMITLKVRTTSWSIRSSRETRKITTVVLKLSFSYDFFFSVCFRRLTPLNSFAGARCDATCYPRG